MITLAEALVFPDAKLPNTYFANRYPNVFEQFGAAFFQEERETPDGLTEIIPLALNADFFAGALGSGQRIVFYLPEQQFYSMDREKDAYTPINEGKLKLLISNQLIKCAESMSGLVAIEPLVLEFRSDEVLNRVIKKAKALLSVEAEFFTGERGHKRWIGGKVIEPTAKPCYELFVENALVKEPSSAVSVTRAFYQYVTFCREHQMAPLTRQEFKSLVAAVVREHFAVGLRNDVPGQNGKAQEGWCGLSLRSGEQAALGLS